MLRESVTKILKEHARRTEVRSCPDIADGIGGVLLDRDDRRPRARGNIGKACNHHFVERHFPLSKTPLFADPSVEREQLPEIVNEPVWEERSQTHITVSLELFNIPLDAFGNFLDQLALGY